MGKEEKISEMPVCGIIMPISSIDGCNKEHWEDVKSIISEAIASAGYEPSLVSDADDSGIIQKRIVQNIYNNEIVVCDVSGKNPNVMFELGMRLAFDKPTIIVIDDKTDYSFDTGQIEHLSYPRDLRYSSILRFKEILKEKIIATVKASKDNPNYSTFLKNFGEFEVAHVDKKEGSISEVVLSKLDDLGGQLNYLQKVVYDSRIPIVRKEYSELEPTSLDILRREIDAYCRAKNLEMSQLVLNKNNERNDLLLALESIERIRRICRTPERLRRMVDIVL
jgi:hypothetical protein